MGAASKTCSVILRLLELSSAAIVAGLVGQYLHYLDTADTHASSRIVYAEVISGISILFSLIFMPPLRYSFYGFLIDFALFICWMVAFGLMANLTASHGCRSYWYWNWWGYYWGGFWHTIPSPALTQSLVGTAGCSKWRTVLAFSFIGGWCWFTSGILGIYVCSKDLKNDTTIVGRGHEKVRTRIIRWLEAGKNKHERSSASTAPTDTTQNLGNGTEALQITTV